MKKLEDLIMKEARRAVSDIADYTKDNITLSQISTDRRSDNDINMSFKLFFSIHSQVMILDARGTKSKYSGLVIKLSLYNSDKTNLLLQYNTNCGVDIIDALNNSILSGTIL